LEIVVWEREMKKQNELKFTKLNDEEIQEHKLFICNEILECGCGGFLSDFENRFKKTFGGD